MVICQNDIFNKVASEQAQRIKEITGATIFRGQVHSVPARWVNIQTYLGYIFLSGNILIFSGKYFNNPEF